MPSLHILFLLVALILFILASIGVPSGRVSLVAAGLAFLTAALMV